MRATRSLTGASRTSGIRPIEAQVATVPRALAAAGVDRRELAARAERALERRG